MEFHSFIIIIIIVASRNCDAVVAYVSREAKLASKSSFWAVFKNIRMFGIIIIMVVIKFESI